MNISAKLKVSASKSATSPSCKPLVASVKDDTKTNIMGHRTYISFKTEDEAYKNYIQDNLDIDMIDNSLNDAIVSDDLEYIMRVIREEYLSDSTVTIFLFLNW